METVVTIISIVVTSICFIVVIPLIGLSCEEE